MHKRETNFLCMYENEKQFFVYIQKRETVKNVPPGFKFKSGYPRHHYLVTNWFTCNKLRVLCLTKPGA